MPKRMIGDAYLYIPWLLPVTESSKWNRSVPVFNEKDRIFFIENEAIQKKFLHSIDFILDSSVYIVKIIKYSQNLNWVNVKFGYVISGMKVRRFLASLRSLNYCGHPELAKSYNIGDKLGQKKV